MSNILLGQLGANGDCLYATVLARQLRHDQPDAHITWAISSQCADVVRNNPYIDETWIIPAGRLNDQSLTWQVFEREAFQRMRLRQFDEILLSQVWPNNFQNYDGTVRPSILRSYGRPITVPIENIINLTASEIDRVDEFAVHEGLATIRHRILFECSPKSGQSFMTPDLGQEIADHFYALVPDSMVIFNSHLPMTLRNPRSRYSGGLSLRESAWLTRHCSLFVGCGSGGTVAATSTAAACLPMIQLLAASTSVFASFAHDFEYFGLTGRPVVEMTDERPEVIAQAMAAACQSGIEEAAHFGQTIPVSFEHYFLSIQRLLKASRYLDAARSLQATAQRYGWTSDLVGFAGISVIPHLRLDPSWLFSDSRRIGEAFRAEVADAEIRPALAAVQQPGGYRQLGRTASERLTLTATAVGKGADMPQANPNALS